MVVPLRSQVRLRLSRLSVQHGRSASSHRPALTLARCSVAAHCALLRVLATPALRASDVRKLTRGAPCFTGLIDGYCSHWLRRLFRPHWAYFALLRPQGARFVRPLCTREPFGKWYAVGSSTAQKPPVMPPFFKGRWHGVSRGGGIQKGGGTAQAVTEGLTPLSRLAPAAFHNSQWSFRCAHKFACGSPLFIGLTSRCFAHSARASCAPFRKGEPFGAQAATISRIFRTSF